MRVFVSSTVYDLLDIRAEVARTLKELGVDAVLSDDKLSGFDSRHNANSIETCLVNVEMSDVVVVILDQRYGPSLGNVGFDDVSATHLEYRRAKELKKPIYFYVRDRLEAEHSAWKKNGKKVDFTLTWATDIGLLHFLDEHRRLGPKRKDSNWIGLFTNSVDLKEALRRQLEPRLRPQMVIDAITTNHFPIFSVKQKMDWIEFNGQTSLKISAEIENIGGSPAFNFVPHWIDEKTRPNPTPIVAPSYSTQCQYILHDPSGRKTKRILTIDYDTSLGVHVCETYEIYAEVHHGLKSVVGGPTLIRRIYRTAPPLTITIDDA